MLQGCPKLCGTRYHLHGKKASYHRQRIDQTLLGLLYIRILLEAFHYFPLAVSKHGSLLHIKEIDKEIEGLLGGVLY